MFIILDNSLPDGKGIDFINYFKSNIPEVKIIVCSADDLEEELKRQAVNVYSVIKKPFLFKELISSIVYPALLSVADDFKNFPKHMMSVM
jgi:response regulator of citrate/malate metabolism